MATNNFMTGGLTMAVLNKQAMPAKVTRKGLMSGPVTEFCCLWKVKPGRGKATVDRIAAGLGSRPGGARETYANIGVHDARYVLLENDTWLLITISFDNDFDKYFDDALAYLTGGDPAKAGFDWLENLEGFPEGGYRSLTWEEVKNWLATTQTQANIFANTDDASVQAIRKALRVQKAFQQVLDHPEAAQALKHPALKPLLEEAAA